MDQYIKDKNILTDKQQEEYDTQKAIFARYSDPEAYRKNKMYENAMELQTKIDRLRSGFKAYQEIQVEKKQQYPSIIDKIKAMFAPKQKTIAAAPEVIEPTVAPIEPTAEPVKEETETEKTWVERLEETPAMKTVQEKIVEPLEDAVDKKAKTNKLFALLAGKVNTIDNNKEEENKEEKNRDAYFRYLNEKQAKGEFTQEQVEEAAAKYDRNLEMKNNPNELLNMAEDKEEKLQYESYLGYLDKQIAKGELTKEEAEEYATKFKQEGETKKDITWLERENSTNLFEMLQEGKINQEQYDRLRKQAEYDNVTEKNTKLEYDADDYTEDLLAKFAKIRQDIIEEINSGAITQEEGYAKIEEIENRFSKKESEERRKSEEEAQI